MKSKIAFKREFSAGCVVYKKLKVKSQKLKIQFLIGKHSGYHKWVLPKGLIEPGEKDWQTALRETEEEMGVKAKLASDKPIHKETYFFYADYKALPEIPNFKHQILNKLSNVNCQMSNVSSRRVAKYQEDGGNKTKVFKTVTFYLAEYLSGDPKDHGWEISAAGWVNYKEALKKLAFEGEKEAVRKAKKIIDNS